MAEKGQNELLKARERTLSVFREDAEQEWKAPFYFIQGADPQFGLMKAYAIGDCNSGGDEWEAELQLTRQAVEAINRLDPKPKFFVLCGDLIHGMPGTEWREAQIWDLKNVLKDLRSDIPLVFVSGNHDLGNTPTPETINDYCQHWGDDYFSFWLGGIFFLVLNSQLYFDASQCPELKKAQDAWLEEQLVIAEKKKCHHAVIFQHIPLFVSEPDEDHNYFNLEKVVRHELLEKFHRAGVKAVFSGHCHKNAGGTYKDLEMVVSSAIGCQLGEDTHGVRIVAITAKNIVHRYYSLSELSNHQEVEKELRGLIKPN